MAPNYLRQLHSATEIKYIKVILYYTNNVILFEIHHYKCNLVHFLQLSINPWALNDDCTVQCSENQRTITVIAQNISTMG